MQHNPKCNQDHTENFMETQRYNPSPLEVEFAKAITELQQQIQDRLKDNAIVKVNTNMEVDNPQVNFTLQDKDGDNHEIVIKIIQRIDKTS